MANPKVGVITTASLADLLGPELEIRKSERGAKYPLYLSTKIGPWPWNTKSGQDILLENGQFLGAESVENSPEPAQESPETPPDKEEEIPGEEKPISPAPPSEKPGFLSKVIDTLGSIEDVEEV